MRTLASYNEMSTPLPFLVYSAWGTVFGFDLPDLRVLSLVIAFITFISFYFLANLRFHRQDISWLLTLFLVFHPYMIGFSLFVFTDMLTILLIILTCIGILRENFLVLLISMAFGLLSRQYYAFVTIAAGLYYLIRYMKSRQSRELFFMIGVGLSCLPLLGLFLLWHGASPSNTLQDVYLQGQFEFHPSALTLYTLQLFVYFSPLVILRWKSIYKPFSLIMALPLSAWYWFFPVHAAASAGAQNIDTVGFFHRFIRMFGQGWIENILLYLTYFLAIPVLIYMIANLFRDLKETNPHFNLFSSIAILTFLVIMPFSYLVWEKYFMLLVPIGAFPFFPTGESFQLFERSKIKIRVIARDLSKRFDTSMHIK